jgi:hypothetical protein
MRRGGESSATNSEYLFNAAEVPVVPEPTHPKSPVGMMAMQPMPANVMSPDDMLRAYAERRQTVKSTTISYPAPVANYGGNGMRILYSPTSPTAAVPVMGVGATAAVMDRESKAHTIESQYSYSDDVDIEDAYVGTAE